MLSFLTFDLSIYFAFEKRMKKRNNILHDIENCSIAQAVTASCAAEAGMIVLDAC